MGGVKMNPFPYRWVVADCFLPEVRPGDLVSHESLCVVNLGLRPAHLALTAYFEGDAPQSGYSGECPPERCRHIRLDQLVSDQGTSLPHGVPYALVVESDVDLVVQHTRLDTTQPALALMTTMAQTLHSSI